MSEIVFEKLIEKIYSELLLPVEQEYQDQDLKKRYSEVVVKKYSSSYKRISTDKDMVATMMSFWEKEEREILSKLSLKERYATFSEDLFMKDAVRSSNNIFKYAIKKATTCIDDTEREKAIEIYEHLKSLQNKIQSYNFERFKNELSESNVDINYILDKSEYHSVRLNNHLTG